MHVGQSELSTLVAERQALVIDPTQMHDRGLDIMHMDWFFGDVPAELVGRANDVSTSNSAAGHPPTKRLAKVIPSVGFVGVALAKGRASKLGGPNDQGILEHTAFFKIFDQCRCRDFGVFALLGQLRIEIVVLIPTGVHKLHEANSSFEQSSSD